jgi:hypothetical protein
LIIHRRQRHERRRPTSCTSAHPLGLARVRVPAGPTSAGRNRSIVHGCPSTLARRGHAANLRPARRCEARPRRGHCQKDCQDLRSANLLVAPRRQTDRRTPKL